MKSNWFNRFVLPGFVFKAAVIGGGYMSGRELAQYFSAHGPWGGLLGMLVATVIWSCVYAVTLEFARTFHAYDYRTFFKALLGRGWVVFEAIYLIMLVVVISVLSATAGTVLHELTAAPEWVAVSAFMLAVSLVLFFGTGLVERFLSLWSFVLYTFYALFVVFCFVRFGDRITDSLQSIQTVDVARSVADGARYAGYNIAAMTAVLFCARHIGSRRDAIIGGLLGGPLAMIPGIFFFLAMSGFDPAIRSVPVPVSFLLDQLRMPIFQFAFLAVMFGTLIGTCTALLHAINERAAKTFAAAGRTFPPWARAAVSAATMILSVVVADKVGLVALVARGYGYMAWAFILVFVVPVLTIGVWKLVRRGSKIPESGPSLERAPT